MKCFGTGLFLLWMAIKAPVTQAMHTARRAATCRPWGLV